MGQVLAWEVARRPDELLVSDNQETDGSHSAGVASGRVSMAARTGMAQRPEKLLPFW